MRSAVLACALIVAGQCYAADPPAEASARAKASLALAKAKANAVSTAPAPRAVPTTWTEAKAAALKDGRPVVAYVGCPVPKAERIPGAHTVSVSALTGYDPHTLVVCYPSGGALYAEATLPCAATTDEIHAAVKKAAAKAPNPEPRRDKPVRALDWG